MAESADLRPHGPCGRASGKVWRWAAAWHLFIVFLQQCSSDLRRPLKAEGGNDPDGNWTRKGRKGASEIPLALTWASPSPLMRAPSPLVSLPLLPRLLGLQGEPLLRINLRTPPIGGAWIFFSALLPVGAPLPSAHLHGGAGEGPSQSSAGTR